MPARFAESVCNMNTDSINVTEQKLRAFKYGQEEFSDSGLDPADVDFAGYSSTAHYANIVMPYLRELAGFKDDGHGCYQTRVEVVPVGIDSDVHGGEPIGSEHILDEIVASFYEGVYHVLEQAQAP